MGLNESFTLHDHLGFGALRYIPQLQLFFSSFFKFLTHQHVNGTFPHTGGPLFGTLVLRELCAYGWDRKELYLKSKSDDH